LCINLTGFYTGTGLLLSPTLVITCAHVLLERQTALPDVTWTHFRRDFIKVNEVDADIIATGDFQNTDDADIAFVRCQTALTLSIISLVQPRLDQFKVPSYLNPT
jgi:hypothetical protein